MDNAGRRSKARRGAARDRAGALLLPRFAERSGGRDVDILVAAFHCIAELGIAATTTRAVASRAGVNQGAIHYYFASKDDLLLGVLRGLLQNTIDNMRTIRDSDLTPGQKLDCVLRVSERFVQEPEEVIVRVALWATSVAKGGVWRDVYRDLFDDFRAALIAIIEEGRAAGIFHPDDSSAAAEIIITTIFGLAMQYTMQASYFTEVVIGDRLAEFYRNVLGMKLAPTRGRRAPPSTPPAKRRTTG